MKKPTHTATSTSLALSGAWLVMFCAICLAQWHDDTNEPYCVWPEEDYLRFADADEDTGADWTNWIMYVASNVWVCDVTVMITNWTATNQYLVSTQTVSHYVGRSNAAAQSYSYTYTYTTRSASNELVQTNTIFSGSSTPYQTNVYMTAQDLRAWDCWNALLERHEAASAVPGHPPLLPAVTFYRDQHANLVAFKKYLFNSVDDWAATNKASSGYFGTNGTEYWTILAIQTNCGLPSNYLRIAYEDEPWRVGYQRERIITGYWEFVSDGTSTVYDSCGYEHADLAHTARQHTVFVCTNNDWNGMFIAEGYTGRDYSWDGVRKIINSMVWGGQAGFRLEEEWEFGSNIAATATKTNAVEAYGATRSNFTNNGWQAVGFQRYKMSASAYQLAGLYGFREARQKGEWWVPEAAATNACAMTTNFARTTDIYIRIIAPFSATASDGDNLGFGDGWPVGHWWRDSGAQVLNDRRAWMVYPYGANYASLHPLDALGIVAASPPVTAGCDFASIDLIFKFDVTNGFRYVD